MTDECEHRHHRPGKVNGRYRLVCEDCGVEAFGSGYWSGAPSDTHIVRPLPPIDGRAPTDGRPKPRSEQEIAQFGDIPPWPGVDKRRGE